MFYNAQTQLLSRPAVVDRIVKLGEVTLGNSYQSVLKTGFRDTKSDRATRVSFKVISPFVPENTPGCSYRYLKRNTTNF